MNLDQFLDELKKLGDGWRINKYGRVRRYRRSRCECPITALANERAGKFRYQPSHARIAATQIRLAHRVCDDVISAADYKGPSRTRKALLKALGLDQL